MHERLQLLSACVCVCVFIQEAFFSLSLSSSSIFFQLRKKRKDKESKDGKKKRKKKKDEAEEEVGNGGIFHCNDTYLLKLHKVLADIIFAASKYRLKKIFVKPETMFSIFICVYGKLMQRAFGAKKKNAQRKCVKLELLDHQLSH